MDEPKQATDKPMSQPQSAPGRTVLDSRQLFRTAAEVEIRHAGEVYRLRCTRAGKLILTK